MTRHVVVFAVLMSLLVVVPNARAQAFLGGMAGYDFGGNTGCSSTPGCEDRHSTWGFSGGVLRPVGFEAEFFRASNFWGTLAAGENPNIPSNNYVFTAMGNVLVAPKFQNLNPYLAAGLGLLIAHSESGVAPVFVFKGGQFAGDVGGGAIVFFGRVGLRGDVRHVHSFQEGIERLSVRQTERITFNRVSVGIVLLL